ncbi:hypothetical protein Tco_0527972 [Tanacetum coccineum]
MRRRRNDPGSILLKPISLITRPHNQKHSFSAITITLRPDFLQHKAQSSLIGDVIDWDFLAHQNLDQAFFDSISTDPFSGPQWGNLFRVNEPIYRELVREFFASFEFEASACKYDPEHAGIKFILGGEPREMPLLELGWGVRLYTKRKSRDNANLSGLSKDEMVKENHLLMEFWPSIGDGGFKIARLFGLLTNKIRDTLSIEPPHHVFKKKSLIAIGAIMELQNEICVWLATRAMEEEKEAEEEAEGEATNKGASDSAEMYRNISQGD